MADKKLIDLFGCAAAFIILEIAALGLIASQSLSSILSVVLTLIVLVPLFRYYKELIGIKNTIYGFFISLLILAAIYGLLVVIVN